ncbi:hypothetical protein YEEN111655_11010 [Yersinia entomophaga]
MYRSSNGTSPPSSANNDPFECVFTTNQNINEQPELTLAVPISLEISCYLLHMTNFTKVDVPLYVK